MINSGDLQIGTQRCRVRLIPRSSAKTMWSEDWSAGDYNVKQKRMYENSCKLAVSTMLKITLNYLERTGCYAISFRACSVMQQSLLGLPIRQVNVAQLAFGSDEHPDVRRLSDAAVAGIEPAQVHCSIHHCAVSVIYAHILEN